MKHYPKAKTTDVIVSNYKDELLLYDLKTHKCHSLNKTASEIWQACNGKRDITVIAKEIFANTKKEARENLARLSLNELANAGLLEKGEQHEFTSRVTRREMIRTVGKTTMVALPLVASVTAPKANAAQSSCTVTCFGAPGNCCNSGQSCCDGRDCCNPGEVCCATSSPACCPVGEICITTGCCPPAQNCLGSCCNPGQICDFGVCI